MKDHVVTDGDCFTSIASENGFFWKTLWDHPDNAELKEKRKDPFTLAPGDVIHIPDVKPTEYTCATGKSHEFRRKGIPARLRIQLVDFEGKPRANTAYDLDVDGTPVVQGAKTDGEGWIDHPIGPGAQQGTIRVAGTDEEYGVLLGHLRPVEDVAGAKMRLMNLGFYSGALDDEQGDDLYVALVEFQAGNGVEPSGELDAATRAALKKAYGG